MVTEGADAWKRIKERARMDREDWRLVGRALLIGRRLHTSNQGFGQWCRENGFGDMDARVRADAMWLAEKWDEVFAVFHAVEHAHPAHIRQAYREATKAAAEGKAKPVPFTQDDADYAMKLHRMAEGRANAPAVAACAAPAVGMTIGAEPVTKMGTTTAYRAPRSVTPAVVSRGAPDALNLAQR